MSYLNLRRLATTLILGIAASVASAGVVPNSAFVNFVENPDETSNVAVTNNLSDALGNGPVSASSATAEGASINGYLVGGLNTKNPIGVGTFWAGLTEPGSNVLSDLVRVIGGSLDPGRCEKIGTTGRNCQSVSITFWSDSEGGTPLEGLLPANAIVTTLVEDGTLQEFFFVNDDFATNGVTAAFVPVGLIVRVQSDLDPARVPEPSALLLLAGGLAALFGTRRKGVARG